VKPKLFIASSVEGLEIAEAVNLNLEYVSENTLWSNAFQLSSVTLTSLAERAQSSDFGVFIFTPDDQIEMRGNKDNSVRDNVLFELGIFIGSLGIERCFIIKPRDISLHIPTDLGGVTIADYEPNRSDNDLSSALSSACTKIKMAIKKLVNQKVIEKTAETFSEPRVDQTPLAREHDLQLFQKITDGFQEYFLTEYISSLNDDHSILASEKDRLRKFIYYSAETEYDFINPILNSTFTEFGLSLSKVMQWTALHFFHHPSPFVMEDQRYSLYPELNPDRGGGEDINGKYDKCANEIISLTDELLKKYKKFRTSVKQELYI
jgi:hypothetical protein